MAGRKGMRKKPAEPTTLYSIWNNRDDSLIILDGTADKCSEMLGITKDAFYHIVCRGSQNYTITKAKRCEIEREVEE